MPVSNFDVHLGYSVSVAVLCQSRQDWNAVSILKDGKSGVGWFVLYDELKFLFTALIS